jgi:predicted HTH transcriptional regulator
MGVNREQLGQLLLRPTESLNIETKTWLDPRTPAGVAKLIKTLFALHNRNGGTFVIGFNDETLLPDSYNLDADVRRLFHLDAVQFLVSKYASQVFEVEVHLLSLNGVIHPVIVVPQGLTVPVVVKANLLHEGKPGKHLLTEGDLYF